MNRAGTFNPRVVLGLLLFGALAFLATLYLIGTGADGGDTNNGGAHAAGKGLNGYAALAEMLRQDGREVTLSRNKGKLDEAGLLVLTPPTFADAKELQDLIDKRRTIGPTLVILPKWQAFPVPRLPGVKAKPGWVALLNPTAPEWAEELDMHFAFAFPKTTAGWTGLGKSGAMPAPDQVMTGTAQQLAALVRTAEGATLAGYLADGDGYPELEDAAGRPASAARVDKWPVTFVIDPDLVNNYGLARADRAQLAVRLVELAGENDTDLPITFDLTFNGLGGAQNLLTLAFTPPFLAATLCLLLAMVVVAWRAFRRFGPPLAEDRAIAFGKTQLVRNSAGLILRSRRLHLLTGPYAAMLRTRLARQLALRQTGDMAIDAALARRAPAAPRFSTQAAALTGATRPKDILRAADALQSIERTLAP